MKPPAKVSPAPVGSTTVSSGSAGAAKQLSWPKSSTPCSPFFTTSVCGPIARTARAAFTRFHSPDSSRASWSLISSTSTLASVSRSSAGLPLIQ